MSDKSIAVTIRPITHHFDRATFRTWVMLGIAQAKINQLLTPQPRHVRSFKVKKRR